MSAGAAPRAMADTRARQQLRIAAHAGLGSAFGFLLWLSAAEFCSKSSGEIVDETVAIVIVALGVVVFVEPWIERLKGLFGLAEEAHVHRGNRLLLLFGALLAILVASFSHGLLATLIERNPWGAFGVVLGALVLPGGITYAWMRGACQRPPRATLSGLVIGGALGICYGFAAVFLVIDRSKVPLNDAEMQLIAAFSLWPLFGLVGGMAVDRRWWRRPSRSVPLAVVGVAAAVELAAGLGGSWTLAALDDLAKVCGWMLGFMLHGDAVDRNLGVDLSVGASAMPDAAGVD